jgi:DNA-binding transcriptional MerR regulator
MQDVAIGEASRQSGVKIPTIRYYEDIGLLPTPARSEANRRSYGQTDVRRLGFIRHARVLGFEIAAIRTLFTLQDNPLQSCGTADAIAKARLDEVNQRIGSLTALKRELELMIEGCRHGQVGECKVIEILADHGKCSHHQH